jgi:hypothetical protein
VASAPRSQPICHMGEINLARNGPETAQELKAGGTRHHQPGEKAGPVASTAPDSVDELQLTKLISVVNGFRRSASAVRAQVLQAMGAVRAGTYQVDPLQVSRRIVGDLLAWPPT